MLRFGVNSVLPTIKRIMSVLLIISVIYASVSVINKMKYITVSNVFRNVVYSKLEYIRLVLQNELYFATRSCCWGK